MVAVRRPEVLAPPDVQEEAAASDLVHVELARRDVNTFIEYVMRDERTGLPVLQAPIHEAWHDEADHHARLLIWSHVEAGKTSQLAIGRTLWALYNDPSTRVVILSNTHHQAEKITRTIANYIQNSEALARVSEGKLRPALPWSSTVLTVERPTVSKDPSVLATGVHGNITGARIDLLIMDDILDYENCKTTQARNDLWDWYNATVVGRLTENARVICIGTAFHPDDALHRFARQAGWQARRYPVLHPDTGLPRWPERWPMERIQARMTEMGSLESARQLMCIARDDSSSRFRQQYIDKCLINGRGKKMASLLQTVPKGCRTYTGVDLAVQKGDAADLTVLFSVLVDQYGNRRVLGIESGKWSGPEIIQRICDAHYRYQSIVIVENNSAQDFILQFTRNMSDVPVRAFTTGRNKAHPEFGVEGLATEFENGKWTIPCEEDGTCAPEVSAWISEMLYYDPNGHTGDRLMACWFAREGIRQGALVMETGHIELQAR